MSKIQDVDELILKHSYRDILYNNGSKFYSDLANSLFSKYLKPMESDSKHHESLEEKISNYNCKENEEVLHINYKLYPNIFQEQILEHIHKYMTLKFPIYDCGYRVCKLGQGPSQTINNKCD